MLAIGVFVALCYYVCHIHQEDGTKTKGTSHE